MRHLLVTPEIADHLDGKHSNMGFPDAEADHVIGYYLAGYVVRTALTYKEKANPELERLDGLIDDVWAMCFRKPRPGWRLLGRFIEKGTFIGLRTLPRSTLGNPEKYFLAAHQVIADWEAMLGAVVPLRARTIEEYLGGVWIDANDTA